MILFLYILSWFLMVYSIFGLVMMQPIIESNTGYYSWIHFICVLALLGVGGSDDDCIEEGFLPKGKSILFRAMKVINITEDKQWREN